jgi:4-amino-4-deoxy-L-arabinose transferase-like glycosyltransferase
MKLNIIEKMSREFKKQSLRKTTKHYSSFPDLLKFLKKQLGVGGVIFFLALGIRILYLADSADNPTFSIPIIDAMTYDTLAQNFVKTGKGSDGFFWQSPFYPLFLSMIYKFFGTSMILVKILQAILGAFTCFLTYRLGTMLFDQKTGFTAGIISAFYIPMLFFEMELLAAGWATFFSVLLIFLLLRQIKAPNNRNIFYLGLCAALCVITRPVFLPFFAIAGIIGVVLAWNRSASRRTMLIAGVCLIAGFLIISVPTALWNKHLTGYARILPYSGGLNLYVGNNPDYEETIKIRPGNSWQKLMDIPVKLGLNDPSEGEKYFFNKVKTYAREHPKAFFTGLVRKGFEFISAREIPRNTDIYLFRQWSVILKAGVWKIGRWGFPFGCLLPLALLGMSYRYRTKGAWLILFVVVYTGAIVLVFVSARYRIPIIPALSVFAANAAVSLHYLLRRMPWRVILILVIGVISSMVLGRLPQETIHYRSELYYGIGSSCQKQGRITEAITAYQTAIAERDDYLEVYNNLGNLYMQLNLTELALNTLQRSLAIYPNDDLTLNNLAVAYSKLGRFPEAEAFYRKSLVIEPDVPYRLMNLGLCLLEQEKEAEAKEIFDHILRIDPNYKKARNVLNDIR